MQKEITKEQQTQQQSSKKPYQAPELVEHGAVEQVTECCERGGSTLKIYRPIRAL